LFGDVRKCRIQPRPSCQPDINTNAGFSMLQRTIGQADDLIRTRPRHRAVADDAERAIVNFLETRKAPNEARTAPSHHLESNAASDCGLSDGDRAIKPRSTGRSHRAGLEEMAYRWLNIACFFMTGMALMTLLMISVEAIAKL